VEDHDGSGRDILRVTEDPVMSDQIFQIVGEKSRAARFIEKTRSS
jgi:hypothetical protein